MLKSPDLLFRISKNTADQLQNFQMDAPVWFELQHSRYSPSYKAVIRMCLIISADSCNSMQHSVQRLITEDPTQSCVLFPVCVQKNRTSEVEHWTEHQNPSDFHQFPCEQLPTA